MFIDLLLPKVKAYGSSSLCVSLKCFQSNQEVFKKLDTLKSLTLKITKDSEATSEELKNFYGEGNNNVLPFVLERLELIGTEPNILVTLNTHMVSFI